MATASSAKKLIDADSADTVRLNETEASAVGMRALKALGYPDDEAKIIVDQLIDNALCGYRFASLPRILAIATDPKHLRGRQPIKIVNETPLSALMDGGNNVGYVTCYRAAHLAAEKAKKTGFASVGVYNSYYCGRNAYFVEQIVKQGLVGFHICERAAARAADRRHAAGARHQSDLHRLSVGQRAGHLRHGHRRADVGRRHAARAYRRAVARGHRLRQGRQSVDRRQRGARRRRGAVRRPQGLRAVVRGAGAGAARRRGAGAAAACRITASCSGCSIRS